MNTSYSQDYKRIEWDILGAASLMPTSNDLGNTLGFYSELRLNLNNKLSLGLNYKWQFFGEMFNDPIRGFGVTNASAITADYYFFNKRNRRAFVGLGVGFYDNAATTQAGDPIGGTGPGLIPRIGYDLRFLRIMASFNHTFEDDFPNYLELSLGFTIGGKFKS